MLGQVKGGVSACFGVLVCRSQGVCVSVGVSVSASACRDEVILCRMPYAQGSAVQGEG